MNSQERLLRTLRRQPADRVPIVMRLGLKYIEDQLIGPLPGSPARHLQTDHYERLITAQEQLGLDPVMYPNWWHGMFISSWPAAVFRWPEASLAAWRMTRAQDPATGETLFSIATPRGGLTTRLHADRYQKWTREYLIKEERDIELLHYRPDPAQLDTSRLKAMVDQLGQRGIVNLIFPGAWDEALHLRGLDQILMDVYDRPAWLQELLDILTGYSVRVLEQICRTTGLHCVMLNDSYVSLVSPRMYDQFVAEGDRRMLAAVRAQGVVSDLHNCGKTNGFLERMVAAGPDAVETLTPPAASSGGDIELEDAKRRVGDQVCLMGGFNEKVLLSDDLDDVRREARRCLDAAMAGGGYVLYAAGQIFDARRPAVQALVDTVAEYGAYR
jgi:hypothetical protein